MATTSGHRCSHTHPDAQDPSALNVGDVMLPSGPAGGPGGRDLLVKFIDSIPASILTLVFVREIERAHYPRNAKRMGQHKGQGHFVLSRLLVGKSAFSTALIIVIIDKDQRVLGGQKSPGLAPRFHPTQLVVATECSTDLVGELELGDGSHLIVFRSSERGVVNRVKVSVGNGIMGITFSQPLHRCR